MNKQKKMKLILSSFKEKELLKFFQSFLDVIHSKFYKSIKQISFSCFQSTCQVEQFMVNGYGKTSAQALMSGINNIIDCLIDEQQYSEAMRQCLRKFNVTPYGLNNNQSKKQLLSTDKVLKTVGAQTSISIQKKALGMSTNLSSNSKQSSSKAKSIKDQIFQYFNLQNLKVKNPNQTFSSISPVGIVEKPKSCLITGNLNHSQSKEKYYQLRQKQQDPRNSVYQNSKLSQVYKKIRQIQQKVALAENENRQLKNQILRKKKPSQKIHTQTSSTSNYFTRPSFENQKQKTHNAQSQSSKKISYMQLSLDKKSVQKVPQKISYQTNQKQTIATQNNFQKIDIQSSKKTLSMSVNNNIPMNQQLRNSVGQRNCLADISNIKSGETHFGTIKSQFNTATANTNDMKSNVFLSATCMSNTKNQINPVQAKKIQQAVYESDKKLRSFSVNNNLAQKLNSFNTNTKNPINIISNLNNSFDNSIMQVQKKINIPKLNLQILPNYHGKSNKSLNQSLMDNYQKKMQMNQNQ